MNEDDPERWMRERGIVPIGEVSTRLPRPEVGMDAYRSANILLRRYGERARQVGGARLQALLDAGDEGGVAAWTDILYAMEELRRGPQDGEVRH